jgi:hypothetical protein
MGQLTVMKKAPISKPVSPSVIEDLWQRKATEAAIAGARGVIRNDGPVMPGTPVGRLSDVEWGWVVAAVIFGWISTKAQQAAAEQLDAEQTIRMTALDPEPWDSGAVIAILPELADASPDLDWSAPLSAWSRETMADFLLKAMPLIRKAMIARDLSEKGVTRKSNADVTRQANAAAGGSLMTANELDDEIPF